MATSQTVLTHRGLTLVLRAGSEQHEAEIETTVLQPRLSRALCNEGTFVRPYQYQYAEAFA